MQFISRAQWGARPSRYKLTYIADTRGVKVHYEGTYVPPSLAAPDAHGQCAARVRAIQASHLADDDEDYSDIAYNLLVCPHGAVFEGRGAHRRTGANGTATLNSQHYAVCALLGSAGLTEPTPAQLAGLRDAIEYLRSEGDAGAEIKGHRDGHPTACPGGPLYRWVQQGAPRPGDGTGPGPGFAPFPGAEFFKRSPNSPLVTAMGRRLVAEGVAVYSVGPGPQWTEIDRRSYSRWQQRLGYRGADADGWPGRASWDALKVPKV
ncbi:peptidoglycan-binding protein [Streptomyces coerulescens]|uniref:Peptidoglycan-binding protein n=1 Tax=Streptomyces coerulescens TaxID=29304 RepID=A0ABW0CEM9_STRCD